MQQYSYTYKSKLYQEISKSVPKLYGLTNPDISKNWASAATLLDQYRYLCAPDARAEAEQRWTSPELYRLTYDALNYRVSDGHTIRAQLDQINGKFFAFVATCIHWTLAMYNADPANTKENKFSQSNSGAHPSVLLKLDFPLLTCRCSQDLQCLSGRFHNLGAPGSRYQETQLRQVLRQEDRQSGIHLDIPSQTPSTAGPVEGAKCRCIP